MSDVTPPPVRRRVRLNADARRQLIIDVAQQLFSKRPYSDVSMGDIADAAEIGRANLNYHFGTKRDLYVEVIKNFARLPPLPPVSRTRRPLEEEVHHIIDNWLDIVWQNRGTFITISESGPINSDREIEAILADGREAWAGRLADLLELPGGATRPARGLIHTFQASCETAVDEWLRRERLTRDDVLVLLVETLLTIARTVVPKVLDPTAARPSSAGR
ncbi:TetR family transcriptional regulator [Pandoraea terrae]|uniref:TetR family transcriptional regulator n=1 Tax=Pandoraea terrae TaxID=1537710 RepID=A0A5E4U3P2_9BURK|nr:TetR/AcrR family transcriptional regulator [Pandoraea terrae]VVD94727.1 TetR family transcriptional regulator [Pandoraea terrae]